MTEEVSGTEAASGTTPNPPTEASVSSEPVRNWEVEAKELGWVPKDQYRGNPDHWRDAEEFVRRGAEILPIVQRTNKQLREQIEAERKDFADRLARMERMGEERSKRERASFEAELTRIKAQQKQAASEGDTETFDRLEARREELTGELAKAPEPRPEAKPSTDDHAAKVKAFTDANPWYGTDKELTEYADWWSGRNAGANPNITFEENQRQLLTVLQKTFPSKFKTETAANGHAAVDGGSSFNGASPKEGKLSAKLSNEARAQAAKDVAAGLYKTVEAWAEVYFA